MSKNLRVFLLSLLVVVLGVSSAFALEYKASFDKGNTYKWSEIKWNPTSGDQSGDKYPGDKQEKPAEVKFTLASTDKKEITVDQSTLYISKISVDKGEVVLDLNGNIIMGSLDIDVSDGGKLTIKGGNASQALVMNGTGSTTWKVSEAGVLDIQPSVSVANGRNVSVNVTSGEVIFGHKTQLEKAHEITVTSGSIVVFDFSTLDSNSGELNLTTTINVSKDSKIAVADGKTVKLKAGKGKFVGEGFTKTGSGNLVITANGAPVFVDVKSITVENGTLELDGEGIVSADSFEFVVSEDGTLKLGDKAVTGKNVSLDVRSSAEAQGEVELGKNAIPDMRLTLNGILTLKGNNSFTLISGDDKDAIIEGSKNIEIILTSSDAKNYSSYQGEISAGTLTIKGQLDGYPFSNASVDIGSIDIEPNASMTLSHDITLDKLLLCGTVPEIGTADELNKVQTGKLKVSDKSKITVKELRADGTTSTDETAIATIEFINGGELTVEELVLNDNYDQYIPSQYTKARSLVVSGDGTLIVKSITSKASKDAVDDEKAITVSHDATLYITKDVTFPEGYGIMIDGATLSADNGATINANLIFKGASAFTTILTGDNRYSVKKDSAVTVSGYISMDENATISLDLTDKNFDKAEHDKIASGSGIRGLVYKVLEGTGSFNVSTDKVNVSSDEFFKTKVRSIGEKVIGVEVARDVHLLELGEVTITKGGETFGDNTHFEAEIPIIYSNDKRDTYKEYIKIRDIDKVEYKDSQGTVNGITTNIDTNNLKITLEGNPLVNGELKFTITLSWDINNITKNASKLGVNASEDLNKIFKSVTKNFSLKVHAESGDVPGTTSGDQSGDVPGTISGDQSGDVPGTEPTKLTFSTELPDGALEVDASYTAKFEATGPVSWKVTGLPEFLTAESTDTQLTISGTITSISEDTNFTYHVSATVSGDEVYSEDIKFTVNAPVVPELLFTIEAYDDDNITDEMIERNNYRAVYHAENADGSVEWKLEPIDDNDTWLSGVESGDDYFVITGRLPEYSTAKDPEEEDNNPYNFIIYAIDESGTEVSEDLEILVELDDEWDEDIAHTTEALDEVGVIISGDFSDISEESTVTISIPDDLLGLIDEDYLLDEMKPGVHYPEWLELSYDLKYDEESEEELVNLIIFKYKPTAGLMNGTEGSITIELDNTDTDFSYIFFDVKYTGADNVVVKPFVITAEPAIVTLSPDASIEVKLTTTTPESKYKVTSGDTYTWAVVDNTAKTVTITVPAGTAAGEYTVHIDGTAGYYESYTGSIDIAVVVESSNEPEKFSITLSSSTVSLEAGKSADITVSAKNASGDVNYDVTVSPANSGVSASVSGNTVTITAASTATAGDYTVTITATDSAGNTTDPTPITLVVSSKTPEPEPAVVSEDILKASEGISTAIAASNDNVVLSGDVLIVSLNNNKGTPTQLTLPKNENVKSYKAYMLNEDGTVSEVSADWVIFSNDIFSNDIAIISSDAVSNNDVIIVAYDGENGTGEVVYGYQISIFSITLSSSTVLLEAGSSEEITVLAKNASGDLSYDVTVTPENSGVSASGSGYTVIITAAPTATAVKYTVTIAVTDEAGSTDTAEVAVTVTRNQPSPPTSQDLQSLGSSGGGCDAGFGALALALAIPLFLRRRRS